MTNAFDKRIVRVGIQIENDFQLFEDLDIRCYGEKVAGPESNICTIRISNLTRSQKNYIMRTATPMTIDKNPKKAPILVTLDVGRESFEPFRLFEGTCWTSDVTMPPDIGITLMSTTNNFAASLMDPINYGALVQLESIATMIAAKYGLTLNFTASAKQIANFNYTGGLQTALNKLALCGQIRVHLDNKVLSVFDKGKTRGGVAPFTLNVQNGMVGIPEATASGVRARMLVRPEPQIGGPITIQSQVNPSVNGDYFISSMLFNITNRDDPFWFDLFCDNNQYDQGTAG